VLFVLPLIAFLLFSWTLLVAMACGAIFAIALAPSCEALRRRLGRFGELAPALVVM
jgi:predicted PurR-regulated permease PerM